jgi:hypothetical protein
LELENNYKISEYSDVKNLTFLQNSKSPSKFITPSIFIPPVIFELPKKFQPSNFRFERYRWLTLPPSSFPSSPLFPLSKIYT